MKIKIHCLEATQLKNKINQLQNNSVFVDYHRENKKIYIKRNNLILTPQQRFTSNKHNEEVNKIS